MQYYFAVFAALVAGLNALPQPAPQADAPPPGCIASHDGPFHIAVVNLTSDSPGVGTPLTQLGDGQLNVDPSTEVCQIGDGQIQVHIGTGVNQISDGQLQTQDGADPCKSDLSFTMDNGHVVDGDDRTLEIVANHQLQNDGLIQPDALRTSGFTICENNTLALASSAIFYQCKSGDFYNLYDSPAAAECNAVYIYTFKAT